MYRALRVAWCILPAICCLPQGHTCAQELLLRHFTVKDGLASNIVYNAFQDSRGFIWFCTDQGISRFDGHAFENLTTSDGLPDNEVFALKEDRDRRIWVSSYNAKISFIYNGKVFNAANNALCRLREQDSLLLKLRLDAGNTPPDILLGNMPGLAAKLVENSFFNITESLHLFHAADADYFFSHGRVFAVKGGRVEILFTKVRHAFYHDGFLYVWHVPDRDLFITRALLRAGAAKGLSSMRLPVAAVYDFIPLNDSVLLLATSRGVLPYMPAAGSIDTAKMQLANMGISSALKDNEGNTWFTTLDNGIYFLPAAKALVYKKHNTAAGAVAILPPGRLISGFDSGEVRITDKNGTQEFLLRGIKGRILKIMAVSGTRFIAGTDYGAYIADIASPGAKKIRHDVFIDAIKDVYGRNGSIYIATAHGAGEIDSNGNFLNLFSESRTTAIAAANDDVWLGTLQGVYRYRYHTGISKWDADSLLSRSRITDMEIAGNGDVVFLTHQAGIFVWNGRAIQHIDESCGLSSNICKKILRQEGNCMWVSTNNGMDRLFANRGKYHVRHFPLSSGIAENDIIDFALAGDKLYISCAEGIVELDTMQQHVRHPLQTYITSVMASDTVFISPKNIALSFRHSDLTINYTAISFGDGDNLTYKYMLEGSKTDTVITKLSSVNLGAISPGSYVFKVWAKGGSGAWSNTPAVLSFTVAPPFWLRPWFLIVALLGAAGVVYMLVRKRINDIKNKERIKTELNKKMAKLEMQALRAQINPHFIFNALNAIQNYYNMNDERNANRYMTAFASLIRQTLTHSRENWIALAEEVSMIRCYIELEQMRFKQGFDYEVLVSPAIDAERTKIPAMILQPVVENAITHGLRHLQGRPGRLTVSFSLNGQSILCTVNDNGIGFKEAAAIENGSRSHQSMGMGITTGRIDTINQLYKTAIAIKVIHKKELVPQESGTIVEIIVPLTNTLNDE